MRGEGAERRRERWATGLGFGMKEEGMADSQRLNSNHGHMIFAFNTTHAQNAPLTYYALALPGQRASTFC